MNIVGNAQPRSRRWQSPARNTMGTKLRVRGKTMVPERAVGMVEQRLWIRKKGNPENFKIVNV